MEYAMHQTLPGCRIIEGGPQHDPRGVPAILVQIVKDGTYWFYYPLTNGFANGSEAKEIAEALQSQNPKSKS